MAFSLWRSDHGVLFFVFSSPLLLCLIPWADKWHGKKEGKGEGYINIEFGRRSVHTA